MRTILTLLITLVLATSAYATNWCDDDNAVACWDFSSGSGTVEDKSSNSNTGTLTDGAVWAAMAGTNSPSYADYMVTCDGGNDYINVTNDSSMVFGTGDWTLVIWAIGNNTQPDTHPASIGKGDTGSGEWMLRSVSGGNIGFYGDAGVVVNSYSSDYTNESWIHVAIVVVGGTTSKLYFNGVLRDTDSDMAAADFDDITDLRFCNADGDVSRFWAGSVSESALFSRALNVTDINDIMDNGLGAVSSGLAQPVISSGVF